ncbi:MAG: heavy metal translocating P-type ATPase [Cyclobacteriaceae bacterium]
MEVQEQVETDVACYHCGQACDDELITVGSKSFCCHGCKTVFEILNENDLCEYYTFDKSPGLSLRFVQKETYRFLDEPSVRKKILSFDSASFSRVQFFIPAIHCVSCIWLLENLQRLNNGILQSKVNFSRKQVTIDYKPDVLSLSDVAQLIASLGYVPSINLDSSKPISSNKSLVTKLAVAGFCFANIMLLSFPEYLGFDESDHQLKILFSFLNLALAIPVVSYSGQDYFISAWKSFKQKQINIDVPIAVGLSALFLRSSYDIVLQTGPGYLDSLSGLIFFLLIGRWFQSKTYESLAFDRDYKSYFPLAVQKWDGLGWTPVVVYELKEGDRIKIRNLEIIPADSTLVSREALIDYSFVTGESKPVQANKGDLIYAGGRMVGQPVELVVEKKTSQSHLTSLWNNEIFQKVEESVYKKIIDKAARKFTWVVMALAFATAVYWYFVSPSQMWLVLTSVLMVACPCALALATPFTYGSMLRVFGKNGFYLKNADVIERLASIDAIVFDKTGTITSGAADVKFVGVLDDQEMGWVKGITSSSTHPLSNLITKSIPQGKNQELDYFNEVSGSGLIGRAEGHSIKVGSASFVGFNGQLPDQASLVFVSIDETVRGYFKIDTTVRIPIIELVQVLKEKVVALLSGDNELDKIRMKEIFSSSTQLLFNQSPHDKLQFISELQRTGKKVLMMGDGLNDSGALKQSNVGIALTDDTGVFTPGCDGILKGDQIGKLSEFIRLSKSATTILKIAFGISFFYNIIALSFAVTGNLSPLVAAILMPISSISVVGFSTLAVNLVSKNHLRDDTSKDQL